MRFDAQGSRVRQTQCQTRQSRSLVIRERELEHAIRDEEIRGAEEINEPPDRGRDRPAVALIADIQRDDAIVAEFRFPNAEPRGLGSRAGLREQHMRDRKDQPDATMPDQPEWKTSTLEIRWHCVASEEELCRSTMPESCARKLEPAEW